MERRVRAIFEEQGEKDTVVVSSLNADTDEFQCRSFIGTDLLNEYTIDSKESNGYENP